MVGTSSARCSVCGSAARPVARVLGVCGRCLREGAEPAQTRARAAHARSRAAFRLPPTPPQANGGVNCVLCANACRIGEGERGFCGLRSARQGRLIHLAGTPARGLLHWYRDPLPTNCVAAWVCEGSRQSGRHNLAVFYSSCTADCLFCQNWHYRQTRPREGSTVSAARLADQATHTTYCVCFFGGDPASQMPHALAAAHALARRDVRICWETNGMMHPRLLGAALDLSLATGGCIKFDLKAMSEPLHRSLTGVSNHQVLENFSRAARLAWQRRDPPLVVASTLLVPGYVDSAEVGALARWIAAIDKEIPYSLLAFAPAFEFSDLPSTSLAEARAAERAARQAGLTQVHLGNRHLLGVSMD